jgi:hypothetical protein
MCAAGDGIEGERLDAGLMDRAGASGLRILLAAGMGEVFP